MKSYSLTIRLAALLSLLAFCMLAAIGTALYQGLANQLRQHEHAELMRKVERFRMLLEKPQGIALLREDAMLIADIAESDDTALRITTEDGYPLLVAGQHPQTTEDDELVTASIIATLASTGKKVEITASRSDAASLTLLRNCLERILMQISLAAALFGIGGVLIVRRGLKPLHGLARQAENITVANLDARLDGRGMPRELGALLTSINAMLDRLGTGFSKLSQVSADMAHDLRTPINNLLGQTEVALQTRRRPEDYEALLGSNLEELQRLAKMIDNMLFLARSENAELEIERKPLNTAVSFQYVADYFEGLAEERELRIEIEGQGQIEGDPLLLRRALANLVANALKYAEAGSSIVLRTTVTSSETVLEVANRGTPIDEHHLPRLFDRFYRADASRLGSAQASGLGLAIVRSIMQLHHGYCTVASDAHCTRFSLHFPSQAKDLDRTVVRRRPLPPFQYRPASVPAQITE